MHFRKIEDYFQNNYATNLIFEIFTMKEHKCHIISNSMKSKEIDKSTQKYTPLFMQAADSKI